MRQALVVLLASGSARAGLSLLSTPSGAPLCDGLCDDGGCGNKGREYEALLRAECENLAAGEAFAARGQMQLNGALAPATEAATWKISSAQLVRVPAPECKYALSLGRAEPDVCEACDASADYSAVAGMVVIVQLHGCDVQSKAVRLGAAGAIGVTLGSLSNGTYFS